MISIQRLELEDLKLLDEDYLTYLEENVNTIRSF